MTKNIELIGPGKIARIAANKIAIIAPVPGGSSGSSSSSEYLTIGTPSIQTVGVAFLVEGTYANATVTAIDYSTNGGSTWTAASLSTISGGVYIFSLTFGAANSSQVIMVRDHANQSATAMTAPFVVQSGTTTLAVTTPAGWQTGVYEELTGTYTGPTPGPLAVAFDGGTIYTPLGGYAAALGTWGGDVTAPSVGAHTAEVQVIGNPSISATTGSFTVAAYSGPVFVEPPTTGTAGVPLGTIEISGGSGTYWGVLMENMLDVWTEVYSTGIMGRFPVTNLFPSLTPNGYGSTWQAALYESQFGGTPLITTPIVVQPAAGSGKTVAFTTLPLSVTKGAAFSVTATLTNISAAYASIYQYGAETARIAITSGVAFSLTPISAGGQLCVQIHDAATAGNLLAQSSPILVAITGATAGAVNTIQCYLPGIPAGTAVGTVIGQACILQPTTVPIWSTTSILFNIDPNLGTVTIAASLESAVGIYSLNLLANDGGTLYTQTIPVTISADGVAQIWQRQGNGGPQNNFTVIHDTFFGGNDQVANVFEVVGSSSYNDATWTISGIPSDWTSQNWTQQYGAVFIIQALYAGPIPYGVYPITITCTQSGLPTLTATINYFSVKDPLANFIPISQQTIYSGNSSGTLVATFSNYTSGLEGGAVSLPGNAGLRYYVALVSSYEWGLYVLNGLVDDIDVVTVQFSTQPGGYSFSARTFTQDVAIQVGRGSVLAPTAVSMSIVSGLDNFTSSGTVGVASTNISGATLTASGDSVGICYGLSGSILEITGPLQYHCIDDTGYNWADRVTISASNGSQNASQTYQIPVAKRSGGVIHCSPTLGTDGTTDIGLTNAIDAALANPEIYAGGTIVLAPGTYYNAGVGTRSAISFSNTMPLTIMGTPGQPMPHLTGSGGDPFGSINGRFQVEAYDAFFDGIEISGMAYTAVGSGQDNLVGIYNIGPGNFYVSNSYIHDCNNGLCRGNTNGNRIFITNTYLAYCGTGSLGYTHNQYSEGVSTYLSRVLSTDCILGHNMKTRTNLTIAHDCRFLDGEMGNSNSLFQAGNGGIVQFWNNVLHRGPNNENNYALEFATGDVGSIGPSPINQMLMANNTIVGNLVTLNTDNPEWPDYNYYSSNSNDWAISNGGATGSLNGKPGYLYAENTTFWGYGSAFQFTLANYAYNSPTGGPGTNTIVNTVTATTRPILDWSFPGVGYQDPTKSLPQPYAAANTKFDIISGGPQFVLNTGTREILTSHTVSVGTTIAEFTLQEPAGTIATPITVNLTTNPGGKYNLTNSGTLMALKTAAALTANTDDYIHATVTAGTSEILAWNLYIGVD